MPLIFVHLNIWSTAFYCFLSRGITTRVCAQGGNGDGRGQVVGLGLQWWQWQLFVPHLRVQLGLVACCPLLI